LVEMRVTGAGLRLTWRIRSDGSQWLFTSAADGFLIARMELTLEQGWRLLTNNYDPDLPGAIRVSGVEDITLILARTRAIIGTPK
jgi:hypothetical protein